MNQHARILSAAALVAVFAAAGCSKYASVDNSPPYIVRFQAIDAAGFTHPPVVVPDNYQGWGRTEGANAGTPVAVPDLPINFASFRVDLSKPLNPNASDGTVIFPPNPDNVTVTTPGYCQTVTAIDPATNTPYVEMTVAGGVDNPLFAPVLGVCYNPSGLNPNLTFVVGYQTCAGIGPVITLEPLTSYTIKGHGLKDFAGQALPSFEFDINAADFVVTAAEVATAYHVDPDLMLGMGYQFADITAATPEAPVGFLNANEQQTQSTADQQLTAYMQPWYSGTGIDKAYGAEVRLSFTSYMCYPGYEVFCQGGLPTSPSWEDVTDAANPVHIPFQWLGDYGWPDATGTLRQHLVSLIPLEDGRTYQFGTAAGDWYDFNYADWGNSNAMGGSFTTPAGTPRIVWQSFTGAVPAAGAGTVYPVLDPSLLNTWNGVPFLGIATSEPLIGGVVKLNEVAADGTRTEVDSKDLSLGGFSWTGDLRNRTVSFEHTGQVFLQPDTQYEVAWTGLTVSAATIPDGSYGFRTLKLEMDPTFTGFYGSGFAMREYTSSSGYVVGQMLANSGNANALYKTHAQLYGVRVPADIEYDTTAPAPLSTFDSASEYYDLMPLKANRGSVKLYQGTEAAGVEVAGIGGVALVGFYDQDTGAELRPPATAYGNRAYPGSFIAFVPFQPLQNSTAYTLVADVYTVTGTNKKITMPFSTRPAGVLSIRGTQFYPGYYGGPYDTAGNLTIRTGSRDVVVDTTGTAHNLFIRTSALADPSQGIDPVTSTAGRTYDPPAELTDPILLYRTDPITNATSTIPVVVYYSSSSGFLSVRPENASDLTPSTVYTLIVTSNLKTLAWDASGTVLTAGPGIAPVVAQFTTADQLVCTGTADSRAVPGGACWNAAAQPPAAFPAGTYPHAVPTCQ